jgi:hypothetical protein
MVQLGMDFLWTFYEVLSGMLVQRLLMCTSKLRLVKTLEPGFTCCAGGPDVVNRKPVESYRLPMNDEYGSVGVNLLRQVRTTSVDQVRLLHRQQQL